MALLPPEAVWPLLVCPRCRAPLAPAGEGFQCGSTACAGRRPFPRAGTHPVLVDFERSVLEEAALLRRQGSSAVHRPRHNPLADRLRRLASPPNRVGERHARLLGDRLAGRSPKPRILVIGGGTVGDGADSFYARTDLDVIAFDIYASPWTQFIADAHSIPLADGSVDAVWVQAVLEHVLDPWQAVAEIARVLRPQGLVYAETPFLQHVHEGPYDFTRFTESGHRWLFRRFERLDSGVVAGPGTLLSWTLEYLARGLFRSRRAGHAMRVAGFWLHYLDRLLPSGHAVDGASCVFFYGSKSDREITPAEIVAHYRGAQRPAS